MTSAKEILTLAAAQIGIKEQPTNSNKVKYNTAYYGSAVSGSAYPWCVTFVWWLFRQLGASDLFYDGGKTASSSALFNYHKNKGQAVANGKYQPGDVIYFKFENSGHTAICEKFDGANITTIDGNTGTTNEANGGAVMRRTRPRQYIVGAYRPKYGVAPPKKEEPEMTEKDVRNIIAQYEAEKAKNPNPDEWAKAVFAKVQQDGLMDGTRPHSFVTRQELAMVLSRLTEGNV